ncbi:MAG: response regulator [Clostridia bacterium]
MLKLMVVDDEMVIRTGIRHSIAWADYGVEVVAEAVNGLEAVEKAVAVQPDIIITDIRMPMLDGIGLIRHVRDRLPHTHFILLSGYSDVAYLKEAISIGVEEYVFKNANFQEIVAAVQKVGHIIEQEREARNRGIRRDNLLDENLSVIQESLMLRLLSSEGDGGELSTRLGELGVSLQGPRLAVLAWPFLPDQKWPLLARLGELLSPYKPFLSCLEGNVAVAVINLGAEADDPQIFSGLGQELAPYLPPETPTVASLPVKQLCELPMAWRPVEEVLAALFWFHGQPLVLAEGIISLPVDKAELFAYEGRCISAFVSKNNLRMQVELQAYFELLQQHRLPRKDFLASVTRFLASVNAFSQNEDILHFLGKIEHMGYQEIFDHIGERIWLGSQKPDGQRDLAEQAREYIAAHFTDNLTLETVAKQMYISSGYLSRLFKEKTGTGFKEYIYECRVERAKELLLGDPSLKTYEIATMSGFRDYKHFSQAFLKSCGVSAREYRNAHL